MKKYFKPELVVFRTSDLAEAIGPAQTAYDGSMTVQGWRGTKLEQPVQYEYRLAKNKNADIYSARGVENA